MFNFSDYSRESKFFDQVNKKIIGKIKDEFKGDLINELVELKSKKYSIIAADSREVKKTKEANKNGAKIIKHKEFVDVLFNTNIMRRNMKRNQGKLHRTETFDVFKISLSSFDDKRYISSDDITY